MGNAKLEQIILQTIDIIASKKIASAGFNRTIQATILSCEDTARGKYKVKYQDSVFNAYTENTTVSYAQGTAVFVLIPNGDMSQTKTILGAVSKTDVDYVNATLEQEYNVIGNNVILNDNNTQLCSYHTESIILYNKDFSDDNNILKIDDIAVKEYFSNSDCVIVTANVRTELPEDQKNQGNYGILLGLDFKDPTTNNIFTRYYSLDVDSMDGNPYNFIIQTQQKKVFDIDKENFSNINTIALFVKDFPNQDENITQNDIFISNVSLIGAERIDLNSLNTYALLLNTPKGYIFTDYDTDNSTRTIETEIRIKGQRLNANEYSNIQYYWFIEDNSMTTYNSYYNKYGGQGWKCLNQYNIIKEAQVENDIEVAPAVFDFISGQDTFTVSKNDILVNRVKYKCVVVYNNNVLSKEIAILNTDSEYNFNITSDLGTKFYLNNGQPTLTCICQKKNTEGIYQVIDKENFNYVWAVVNSVGNFSIPINDQNYVIDKNIMKVKVRTITNFSFFKCSIFTSNNGTYLGTVSITLSNLLQDDTKGYSLIINNRDQVFKYSTTGLAPTNQQLDNPIKILALDFNIYDQTGEPLDEELIKNCDITWKVPKSTYSLIKPDSSYEKEEGQGYDIYKNLISFVFDIEDNYNFYKTENQIELQVIYNGIKLFSRTNLVFIKQGEEGTNGTSFVCKIVPNVKMGTQIPINPTIYYDGTDVTFNWDQSYAPYGKWFNIQFWHNGSLIYNDYQSKNTLEGIPLTIVKWEILHNTYSANVQDTTLINVINENDDWSFSLDTSKVADTNFINWRFANIVKVTVRYDGMLYYATLPINFCRIWDKNYKLDFVENTGFTKVLYSSNGINPLYDNHSPFVVNTLQKQVDGTWRNASFDSSIKYEWYYIGSVWQKNANANLSWTEDYEISSYDERNPEERISSNKWLSNYIPPDRVIIVKNVKYVKPADIYNGQCVNVGLACRVYTTNSLLCWIFMPIHMSLNRYENSAINTWDGNSVELGTKGGMILAPQVGAGVKDDENSFTGIFMGTVKDPEEQLSKSVSMFNSFNNLNEDVGLFGYSKGQRSIFLDAKTGKALFGRRGAGQIIIDPSTNQAIIQGGNYVPKDNEHDGSGMQINLSEPSINFGSQKFNVAPDGTLTAVGANLSAINLSSENSTYDGKPFSQMFKDNYQELIDAAVDSLQKQIDGQIMTWYNDGAPTLNNYPCSEWTTDKEKAKHQGDIYYDRLTQYSYRFTNTGTQENPSWSWELIRDEGIATAIQKSAQAKAAADGKRRIFTVQPTYNDEYDVGDLWVNVEYEDSNVKYYNDILICKTAKKSKVAFSIDHWQKASSYLDGEKYQPRRLMKKLTNDNKDNGIWMSPDLTDNKLYINATYINTGEFSITDPNTKQVTFYANADNGQVKIVAKEFSLTSGDTIDSIAASKADSALSSAKSYADTLLQAGYGVCDTNGGTAAKTVTINNFKGLKSGTKISVYFNKANTAASPTLNVSGTGAIPIYARNAVLTQQYYWAANAIVDFVYAASSNRWNMVVENQLETFNRLTKNGKTQGIYLNDGSIYINASMIQSGAINIKKGNKTTFYANANNGQVRIVAKEFSLTSDAKSEAIRSGSINLLRGTNSTTALTTNGTHGNGTWRKAGLGDGGIVSAKINDSPNNAISKGWDLQGREIVNDDMGGIGIRQDNIPISKGNWYTISCYIKGRGKLRILYGVTKYKKSDFSFPNGEESSDWIRIDYPIFLSKSLSSDYVKNNKINIIFMNMVGPSRLSICGMKLATGRIGTDWSESPLDIQKNIDQGLKEYNNKLTNQLSQENLIKQLTKDGKNKIIVTENGKIGLNADTIIAGYLSANHIRLGKLTSKNKGGTEWDLDKGTMKIVADEININVKDPKTKKVSTMQFNPTSIRTQTSSLAWASPKSALKAGGDLYVKYLSVCDLKKDKDEGYVQNTKSPSIELGYGGLRFFRRSDEYNFLKPIVELGTAEWVGHEGAGIKNKDFLTILTEQESSGIVWMSLSVDPDEGISEKHRILCYTLKKRYGNSAKTFTMPANTLNLFCNLQMHGRFIVRPQLQDPHFVFGKNTVCVEDATFRKVPCQYYDKKKKKWISTKVQFQFKKGILVGIKS